MSSHDGCGIYAIKNLETGAVYVGATRKSFAQRWAVHRGQLLHGYHRCPTLQEDWHRLGSERFDFIVLQPLSQDAPMAPHEQFWIEKFRREGFPCYNVSQAYERPWRAKQPHIHGVRPRDPYVTVDELAAYFLVNRRTVLNLLSTRKLIGFRVGRQWRVRLEVLERYIEEQEQQHPEA